MSFLRSKHSGWTHELRRTPFGGGGGDIFQSVGNAFSGVTDSIDQALVGLDKTVGEAVPGGWSTVGAAALAAATMGGSLAASGALEAGAVASADATAAGMGFSSAAEAIQAGAITAEGLGLPAATTVADLGAIEGTASAGFVGSGAEAGVAGGVPAGAAGGTGDVFGGYSASGSAAGTAGQTVPTGGYGMDVSAPIEPGNPNIVNPQGTTSPAGTYGPGSAPVTDYSTPANAATQASADQAAAAQAGYSPMQIAQAAKQGITVAKLLQGAGSALGIIPAAANLFGGGLKGTGATSATDPYAQYRPQAAQQLNTLMNNPSAALSQPGYQQTLTEGLKQSQRGAAATGQLQSGAEQAALQSQGQNVFGSYYNTLVGNLMQMSGASQNPASAQTAAQQIAASKQNMQSQNLASLTSGITGLGSIASLYGGNNPSQGLTSSYTGTAYDAGGQALAGYYTPTSPDYSNFGNIISTRD